MKKSRKKKEKILTVPTFLNAFRILATFVIAYMIFTDVDIRITVGLFVIAALTDWFDGRIARKYNLVSEFGRKADVIADRFLWTGTAIFFLIAFQINGLMQSIHLLQLLLIMTREIITTPFFILAFFTGKKIPNVKFVAKATTFLQGFALPALMLSVFWPLWGYISIPLSGVLVIIGTVSSVFYIRDVYL